MGGRGILDRQHHIDLVAVDRTGIVFDGFPLIAARSDETLGDEADGIALERTGEDGAALAEESGTAGDRTAQEAKGERFVDGRPPVVGDGTLPSPIQANR